MLSYPEGTTTAAEMGKSELAVGMRSILSADWPSAATAAQYRTSSATRERMERRTAVVMEVLPALTVNEVVFGLPRLGAAGPRLRRSFRRLRGGLGMSVVRNLLGDPVGLLNERGHHRVDRELAGISGQR